MNYSKLVTAFLVNYIPGIMVKILRGEKQKGEQKMIIVRTVFQLKFGKAKEAKELIGGVIAINKKQGLKNTRAMMDLTGDAYTLVMETGHTSLAEFETSHQAVMGDTEMHELYAKFVPLVRSSKREIFTIVGE